MMGKSPSDSTMPDVQTTTTPYPTDETVEVPVALLDFLGFFGASVQLQHDGAKGGLSDNETLAQVGWALFKEVGEYTSDDDDRNVLDVQMDELLVKHAGEVGYSVDDVDFEQVSSDE